MPGIPVTVAVLADSHVNHISELPPKVLESLSRADAVIHLGDYTSPDLLNELRKFNYFFGVIGNHDSLIGRQKLKVIEVIKIGGKRLGLIHGLFIPLGRPKRMVALFRRHGIKIDMLLCGHSHLVTNKIIDGVPLFNPGSVTGQFPAPKASFGLLTLDGTITSEIIPLESSSFLKQNHLLILLAILIRNAIRFFEAWPVLDFSRPWNTLKRCLRCTQNHDEPGNL